MKYFFSILLLSVMTLPIILQAESVTAPLSAPQQSSVVPQVQPAPSAGTELFDIKGPVEITDNSKIIIQAAAAITILILLAALIILWRKHSKNQQAVLAHETALQQLLQAQQLIDEHRVDAFITLIDQTLRSYIEQRFAISARRQTTHEFISGITGNKGSIPEPLKRNIKNLQTWLEHCDLVKFARADLSTETMSEMVANLRSFIESTKMELKK
jgi:hypothetical protein